MAYLAYTEAVESPQPDEEKSIQAIIDGMTKQSEIVEQREHHAVRASHAKSSACLTATITVLPNLPEELAQGFFSTPGKHDCIIRFAQGPGETLHDKVSTHRGMAIKIFNVDGEMIAEHDEPEAKTQDWVFATGPTFPSGTAAGFVRDGKLLQMATPAPEIVKSAVSMVARGVASVTGSGVADFYGHPFTHPITDAYFSQAPIRYGNYVAKLAFFPVDKELEELRKATIDTSNDPDAFRTATVNYFRTHDYQFDVRAQLWNDATSMPIEDASVEWSEDKSPYRNLATITIPRQEAHSEARSKYFDDVIAFRPAHALVAHRPIGNVMRARLRVYEAMSKWRHDQNHVQKVEPRSLQDIPA